MTDATLVQREATPPVLHGTQNGPHAATLNVGRQWAFAFEVNVSWEKRTIARIKAHR